MNEAQALIDPYDRLFGEEAWKELMVELEDKVKEVEKVIVHQAKSFEEVQFYRGLLAGYSQLVSYENTRNLIKQMNQDLPDVTV